MAPLLDKKVVIVGGSSGIGFGVAKAVLSEGGHVVICSSNADKVAAAAKRLDAGERVTAEVVDITNESSVKALFEKVGKYDHLVITAVQGAASLASGFPNDTLDLAAFKDKIFESRFWGALYCIKHSQGRLAQSITVTTGTAVLRPQRGWALSMGAAGALMTSMRTLAVDLAPLRVNCIVPGAVETEMWDAVPKEEKDALMEKMRQELPVGHVGTPEEIAEAYLFAMKCTYLTGQEIYVDGGHLLK